jgi:crotonobetainyl-CoA:carnitine CoA-transferase CaiB-like acyl-CoA transferase
MSGPLSGIRVIEIGHMLMGPYSTMLLADLGAEVTKVEPPEGDIGRRVSPHSIGAHNVYFASLNRNKKSVVLDLASREGQTKLGALVQGSHALLTNLRPAAIRKLGLTYAHLKRWNPKIVCVALTGYGLDSPYADRPAYDYVIQALTGIMALTGAPDGPPVKTGYSAVDNSAGIMGALGLVAKLVEGTGGQVDIAMYDVMLSQLNYIAGAWLNAGEPARRMDHSAHPYIVPAQIFPTRDGWIALFITHDDFWRRFAEEVGQAHWLTDARFATMAARRSNRELVLGEIAAVLHDEGTDDLVRRLSKLGVVAAGVETLEQALASEQAAARNMVVQVDGGGTAIRVVGNPIKVLGAVERFAPPPRLGEHDDLADGGQAA